MQKKIMSPGFALSLLVLFVVFAGPASGQEPGAEVDVAQFELGPVPGIGRMDLRFTEDQRDEEWAAAMELEIADIIGTMPFVESSIACRSTICRVILLEHHNEGGLASDRSLEDVTRDLSAFVESSLPRFRGMNSTGGRRRIGGEVVFVAAFYLYST